ncbi:MAG: hypothetical protein ACFFCS_02820 [Candidatus Hodarchaeota archaeon]
MENLEAKEINKPERKEGNPTLGELSTFLYGLIFVTSGWDWGQLPELMRDILWVLTERGLSMWILTGLIFISKRSFTKENWKGNLLSFLIIGCGLYINTRLGYGNLLDDIQLAETFARGAWGWTQAVLLGTCWGLGTLSILLVLDYKGIQKSKKKYIWLSFMIMVAGIALNQGLPLLLKDADDPAAMAWTASLILGAIPLIKIISPDSRRILLRVLVTVVIFFIIASLITSYYIPPAVYAIDRHKIAELTYGLGIGVGVGYIFSKKCDGKEVLVNV